MTLITPEGLADELHIDQSPEKLKTLTTLIADASALIRGSINNNVTDDELLEVAPNQFNRLVASLAQSLYYDRALSDGFSHGQMILLQQLTGLVVGGK